MINSLGTGELTTLIVLAIVLLGVLFLLRMAFKLTKTMFRLGCAIVFLVVAGAAVFLFVL
ncbi:MAG: hypothetical protein ACOC9Z_03445 [Chloroflexota bacterium]